MPLIKCKPHGGLNRTFPEYKLVGKELQKVQELVNLISLDGKIYLVKGASRLNTTAKPGIVRWQKRIYYEDGGDRKHFTFAVIGDFIYKLDESTQTFNQVKISDSFETQVLSDKIIFLTDATIEVAGTVSTFIVDGTYFYKFNGNDSGQWERLPIKNDIDGNAIEPIFIAEYLSRLWVISRQKNQLLGSKNLNPEIFDDAVDSILVSCPSGKGGFPVCLKVHRGFLFVMHENYFVPLSGSSPSTFGIKPGDVINGFGTRAPRSVITIKNLFGFLNSEDNEYYTTGGTLDSTDKIPLSEEINLKTLINPVKVQDTVAHLDTNINAIRISYVLTGEVLLDAEEIYSITEKKWCGQTRGRKISCYSQWNGFGDDGRLTTGRSDTGVVMWENNELNFDDSPIHYKFVSASYVADEDINELQFERFFIDARAYGNFSIPLSYYLDTRLTTRGQESINMQGEIINLGLIEIADQDYFLNTAVPFIDRSKGRMIRFQIEETETNRRFELIAIYAQYNKQESISSKYIPGR